MLKRYEGWLKTIGLKDSSVWDELHFIKMLPGLDAETEDRIIDGKISLLSDTRKWAAPTAYKCRCAFKRFFYWLYDWDKVKSGRVPFQKFYASKGPRPEPSYLTDDKIQKILGNPFLSVRDSLLVRVTYYSGCRRSEICALNIEDIQGKQLHIKRGKRDLWRYVELDDQTATLLSVYIEGLKAQGHGNPGDPLFVVQGWNRMKPHRMWKLIQLAGLRADLKCRPHVLRHSIGRQIIINGGSLPAVQQHLGHRSPSMTMQYIHLTPSDAARFLKR